MTFPFRPEDIPPGSRIGSYTIGAKLGSGGTGVVYEARSPKGHLFALKLARQWRAVLEAPPSVDELRLERSNICHGLLKGHPNVVELHAYERYPDTFSGWTYQVLELVPGGQSITQWARYTCPSLGELTHVFQQLARLLGDMHSQGIRHRDIKPSNVLMMPSGVPKLVDFGSASCARTPSVTRNAACAQPGTPGYLAPELCWELIMERETRQFRPFIYEPAADLHSLGVVLYEVLTGRHPFKLNSLDGESLLWHIANHMPSLPREHNPGVPAWLESIVMMLLRKDPRRRHKSGYILAQELEMDTWSQSPAQSGSSPFPVPRGKGTDGSSTRTQTAVLTEPAAPPEAAPPPIKALVRVERWPSPVRLRASPHQRRLRERRLVGCLALACAVLVLVVLMASRMMWPTASVTHKGADVPYPSLPSTTNTMMTAFVCVLVGCAHVQVREADRDWLAQCPAKARESVRTFPVPQGHNTQADVLEGENVRYLPPEGGIEIRPGPIKAHAYLGQKQAALLHGEARVGDDGVSMQFNKLTIGDEEGKTWADGPWPAGKEFDICAIAFDEGGFGTIGPGLPPWKRGPGSVVIRSMHIDIRVAR